MLSIKRVIILLLTVSLVLLLCACNSFGNMFASDKAVVNEQFDMLLDGMENEDKDKVLSLFSKETTQNVETLASDVDLLFAYFEGDAESYDDWGGPTVSTLREDDNVYQYMDATYDLKTTKGNYRFVMRYVSEDTVNKDNMGIQFVYVIKAEDDTDPEYAYWGDGKDTPGIHIGVKNYVDDDT